jgi:N6-adenosine-specific RNA methylase IME4
VILADPPWRYRRGGVNGAVEAQYPTLAREELAAIPVSRWTAEDCVLVLWGTWPKLDECIHLLTAWGFAYVTGFPWIKTVPGTLEPRRGIGFWTQSVSEIVLIGRRGEPVRERDTPPVLGLLAGGDRQFYAPIRRHSQKPEGLHGWLESQFPGPYLELFARLPRAGWDTWGADLGFTLSANGVERSTIAPPTEAQLSLIEEYSP